MARKIIWALRAHNDRKEILTYLTKNNQSNRYSKKLNQLFKDAIKLIRLHPYIGGATDDKLVRIKLVEDYLLICEVTETFIIILTIWDGRQDPIKLEEILK